MDEGWLGFLLIVVVIGGLVYLAADDVRTQKANDTYFSNQCIDAGGFPLKVQNSGNACFKDATQIPLILKVGS